MPLAKFSKTFNLKELKKGYFSHKFNTLDNQTYVGKYPDEKFYDSKFFSVSEKVKFHAWYNSVKDTIFDFEREFYDYCVSDVLLLTEGCLKFRNLCIEQSKLDVNDIGVDPFKKCITIASYCNYVYRRNFMPHNSIAIIPTNGYNPQQKKLTKSFFLVKISVRKITNRNSDK